MKVPTIIISLSLLCCLLIGCSSYDKYDVDGVAGKFCVPKGLLPPDVWYVPENAPGTPHEITVMGCARVPDSAREQCRLPDGLISATVIPLSVKINHVWGDLKEAVDFREAASAQEARYEWLDKKDGVFLLKSRSMVIPWSLWKTDVPDGESPTGLRDSDELVASCDPQYIQSEVDGNAQPLMDLECTRYVRGKDYAIEYRIKWKHGLPDRGWYERFDTELFRQIDGWRCT